VPPSPPPLAVWVLARALRGDPAAAAILGDLHEDFVERVRRSGAASGRTWYVRESVLLALGRLVRDPVALIAFFLPVPYQPPSPGASDMNRASAFQSLGRDIGHALNTLRRNPSFTLFAAVVMGLGVGAATTVFSVLKPLVLAPLPVKDPGRLVWIANSGSSTNASLSAVTSRTGNLRDFRERTRSFTGLTGYYAFFEQDSYTLTGAGEPERLIGVGVAGNFLDVLGVQPLLGRSFNEAESQWEGPGAVILTYGYWQRRFAGDRSVVGRVLTLNGTPRTVVGVLPPSFDFSSMFSPGVTVDFLRPFAIGAQTDRYGNTLVILGRLKPGVTPPQAQADLDAVLATLKEEQPDRWGLGARLTPLQDKIAGHFRPALMLLAAAAGTLLLIVCVNLSNLLLARAPGRAREVAVRKAMGAPRGTIARQLVLETLGISLLGSLVGAALAWGATRFAATGAKTMKVPLLNDVRVDGSALLLAVGVAILAGLLVALVPALQVSDGEEATVLRASGHGSSASRGARRLRDGLVVAEVTLACTLLVVGGLLVRSFRAVLDVNLGWDPSHAVAWQVRPTDRFASSTAQADFYANLTRKVGEIPGVERVGVVDALPLGWNRSWVFTRPDQPDSQERTDRSNRFAFFPFLVDPGYVPTMKIALVAGRNLASTDAADAPPVVLMNESGARRVFPEGNPVGRYILFNERNVEVVGITRDIHNVSPETAPGIQVYFPLAQRGGMSVMSMVVRSELPTARLAAAVSATLKQIDPAMPTHEFWTLESTVDRAVSARRFTLAILTVYGVVALLLAGLGIYGVLAQNVAERTPEIGIRMALGATAGSVMGGVLVRTLALAGGGTVLGAVLAAWSGRLVGSLLYGVRATDPITYAGMALVLMVVAGVAGLLPARRAARTGGVRALRAD
jgi:putative ABC transport system permease protein